MDPCTLLTDAQRAELNVTRIREYDYEGQPVCAFEVKTDTRSVSVRVMTDTREGAEAWLAGDRNVDAEATTIDGFGAARFWLAGTVGSDCNTSVDVADGQNLQVNLLLPGQQWTREQLCETTDRFAAAALSTLRAG